MAWSSTGLVGSWFWSWARKSFMKSSVEGPMELVPALLIVSTAPLLEVVIALLATVPPVPAAPATVPPVPNVEKGEKLVGLIAMDGLLQALISRDGPPG